MVHTGKETEIPKKAEVSIYSKARLRKLANYLGEKPLIEAAEVNYYRFIAVLKLQTTFESPAEHQWVLSKGVFHRDLACTDHSSIVEEFSDLP